MADLCVSAYADITATKITIKDENNQDKEVYQVVDGFYQDPQQYETAKNFYITNKNGLKYFRDWVNGTSTALNTYYNLGLLNLTLASFASSNGFADKNVYLLSDIDLSGEVWQPIGPNSGSVSDKFASNWKAHFYGSFYGLGHVVSNIDTSQSDQGDKYSRWPQGFFGSIANCGIIDGLILENVNIVSKFSYGYAGAIVGDLGSNPITISNCIVRGKIYISGGMSGGIYGIGNGNIISCDVLGDDGSEIIGGSFAGGLAGAERCSSTSSLKIENNTVENLSISSEEGHIGALVGAFASGAAGTLSVQYNTIIMCAINDEDVSDETMLMETNSDATATATVQNNIIVTSIKGAVISADNKSKVYGESDPKLTASLVNFNDEDKASIIYTITRAAGNDAGTYAITVSGDTKQLKYKDIAYKNGVFTITKADSSVTKAPEAISNLVYNSSAQTLITAGTCTGGEMQYALGTDSNTAPEEGYSSELPTGTDAKEYYIWYKVIGDKNHNDTALLCITAKIYDIDPSISEQSVKITRGTTMTLEIKDSTGTGARTWTLDNNSLEWVSLVQDTDDKATLTIAPDSDVEADSYSCSVTVTNSDNKSSTAKITITVEAAQELVDYNAPDISDQSKSIIITKGTSKTLEIKDSAGTGARTWSLNNGAPNWVSLVKNADDKATLTIAPGLDIEAKIYTFTVTVMNPDNESSTAKITITVEEVQESYNAPSIAGQSITITKGTSKTLEITDSAGTGARTWSLNSDVNWVSLVKNADDKATLTMAPGLDVEAKIYTCTVTVMNPDNKSSTAKISITVENPPEEQTIGEILDNIDNETKSSVTDLDEILTDEQKKNLTNEDLSKIISDLPSLETLDLSGNENITEFNANAHESITSIKLDGCKNIAAIDTSGCSQLEELDVSNCTGLTSLDCSGSSINSLNVTGCTSLSYLNCTSNKLDVINIDDCSELEDFQCGYNNIKELTLKGCLKLKRLYCYSNNIERLEVPSKVLEWLVCDDNKMLNLNIKDNRKLKRLDCQNNSMAGLDIDTSLFTELLWLKCYGQKISDLRITRTGTGYQVNIQSYINAMSSELAEISGSNSKAHSASDVKNIAGVKAYDANGTEIASYYNSSTGFVTLEKEPSKIAYIYNTGYKNVSMDVSIGETAAERRDSENDNNVSTGGSSGGCDSGFGIMSVIVLAFMCFKSLKGVR